MFDIHQVVLEDDWDERRVHEYIDGLVTEFWASPEGQAHEQQCGDGGWIGIFLDYFFQYCDCSFPQITLGDVREVVMGIVPRKVLTEPESAPEIVAEVRAFWSFLARQYQVPQAGQILAFLDDDVVVTLKSRLADPRNFGMAKSFFALGKEAGFDMTTKEGLQEFTAVHNASLAAAAELPEPDDDLALPERPKHSSKERRKKRKAQRQARRRNRR